MSPHFPMVKKECRIVRVIVMQSIFRQCIGCVQAALIHQGQAGVFFFCALIKRWSKKKERAASCRTLRYIHAFSLTGKHVCVPHASQKARILPQNRFAVKPEMCLLEEAGNKSRISRVTAKGWQSRPLCFTLWLWPNEQTAQTDSDVQGLWGGSTWCSFFIIFIIIFIYLYLNLYIERHYNSGQVLHCLTALSATRIEAYDLVM